MTDGLTPRFGIRSSQNHKSWAKIKEDFQAADEWGWESAWVFDHMIPLSDPRTGPNLDGWALLAGLAEATKNVLLGTMVTGITYRNPSMLLKEAVTVDHISNGRCVLAVGAAWFGGEHEMFGFDFPSDGDRVSMLGEALQIFDLLQEQEYSSFDGKFYQLKDAPFFPKPIQQPRMTLLVAGSKPRMLRLIARHADWWDNNFGSDDEYRQRVQFIEDHARRHGRDPSQIRRSTTLPADAIKDEKALRERLQSLRALGITDFLIHSSARLEDMRNFAERIVPELRQEWGG